MYRFLLSRRWIGFAVFVVLLGGVCVRLGVWQLHRLEHRLVDNQVTAANLRRDPVGIDTVQRDPAGRRDDREWTRVRVTGTYDVRHQVVLKYQTRDAGPGVDVVTPLVTGSGRAVLVDRGWLQTTNTSAPVVDAPAPTAGTVTVVGWWRVDNAAGGTAVVPHDGQVRALASRGIAPTLDYPVYSGYIDLLQQDPRPSTALGERPLPEMGQGPHFFYALQWFFFAGLAVFGWFYFAWSEAHPKEQRRRGVVARAAARTHSERTDRAAVDGQHGAGDVRSRG